MKREKKISKEEVRHVAQLAKLTLTENELDTYTKQLGEILSYMDILNSVNTDGVESTYQVIDGLENVLREDEVKNYFTQKEALAQSVKTYKGYFVADHVFSQNKTDGKIKQIFRKKIDKYNAVLTEVDKEGNVGHKDLFMTKGVETTAGSHVLDGYIAHYSSTVVKLLENSGNKTKYKLNLDAWGHGASGENSDYGPTQNPWNPNCVPGGSSSGSGAIIAIDGVDLATGTDTGGSIRQPASFCNGTSIKPTLGGISRFGLIAFTSSHDCPGLISKSAKKLKKYFDIVSKPDHLDSITLNNLRGKKHKNVKNIGLPKEYFGENNDPQVKKALKEAVKSFKKLGYKFVDISLPHSKYGVSVYYIIAPTEVSSNLARFDGVRYGNDRRYFGAEAKRRIMLGTYTSSKGYADKYYEKAARVRTLIIKDFEKAFSVVDAILTPVSPMLPFKIGEKSDDPLQMYLADLYLSAISLAGLPALALPCGFSESGLPIGMQLMGPRWSEEILFNLGEKYQSVTDWHKRKPDIRE